MNFVPRLACVRVFHRLGHRGGHRGRWRCRRGDIPTRRAETAAAAAVSGSAPLDPSDAGPGTAVGKPERRSDILNPIFPDALGSGREPGAVVQRDGAWPSEVPWLWPGRVAAASLVSPAGLALVPLQDRGSFRPGRRRRSWPCCRLGAERLRGFNCYARKAHAA